MNFSIFKTRENGKTYKLQSFDSFEDADDFMENEATATYFLSSKKVDFQMCVVNKKGKTLKAIRATSRYGIWEQSLNLAHAE